MASMTSLRSDARPRDTLLYEMQPAAYVARPCLYLVLLIVCIDSLQHSGQFLLPHRKANALSVLA